MLEDIFIESADIFLRLPTEKDIEGNWYKWLNDPDVTKFQNKGIFQNTKDKQKEYIKSITNSQTEIVFAIIEKNNNKHIGSVGLHKIDWIHRSAELGILIGEKEYWGKGYGKIAWNMITHYGINVLNLHRIYAIVFKENIASQKCAKASGYKIDGEIRDVFFKNGRHHSTFYMSILEDEFKNFFNK